MRVRGLEEETEEVKVGIGRGGGAWELCARNGNEEERTRISYNKLEDLLEESCDHPLHHKERRKRKIFPQTSKT